METSDRKRFVHPSQGTALIVALILCIAITVLCSAQLIAESSQKLFSSPEEALQALTTAVKTNDKAALDQMFGPSGKDLRSSDEVQAASEFDEFLKHLAEKTSLVKENDTKVIIHIGNENWPFPIPLVQKNSQWFFDTEAGREEILNRRIGEDELTAILVCRTYVKAQREYVLKDWDGDGILSVCTKASKRSWQKKRTFLETHARRIVKSFRRTCFPSEGRGL